MDQAMELFNGVSVSHVLWDDLTVGRLLLEVPLVEDFVRVLEA